MSALDTFNRSLDDLRISLIDRCNFRCPYCMPSEKFHQAYQFLHKDEWLSFDEITRLARIFVKLGVTKLRLTGGEPLLRPQLDILVRQLSAIKGVKDLALTTNGSLLKQWAHRLKAAGLGRLTISLDTLDESVFQQMSGHRGCVKDVLEGLQAAQEAGFSSIKINCVVQRGVNDHTILDLVRYFRGTPHSVRFIEYMDVGNQNHWNIHQVVPSKEIIALINQHFPLQFYPGKKCSDTANIYRFKDGGGEVGFISSVSQPFCGSCNRLRISADGKMYTCLFASHGTDLKRHLRAGCDDQFLSQVVAQVWHKRNDQYSQERFTRRQASNMPKVEMYQIGG